MSASQYTCVCRHYGAAAQNYSFNYIPGTMNITPAAAPSTDNTIPDTVYAGISQHSNETENLPKLSVAPKSVTEDNTLVKVVIIPEEEIYSQKDDEKDFLIAMTKAIATFYRFIGR